MRSVAAAALALTLLAAAPAQAAQRYATPSGAGETCEKVQPCSLEVALEKVKNGDEVIVTSGTYTLTKAISLPFLQNLSIHGESPGHPPRIEAALPSGARMISDFEGSGVSFRDLELVNNVEGGRGLVCGSGVEVDRVSVSSTGGGGTIALEQSGTCIVRDSLLRTEGTQSVALFAQGKESTGLVRNVTALAGGAESIAVSSNFINLFGGEGHYTLNLENVIASGATDLAAHYFEIGVPMTPFGPGNIEVGHSNFDSASAEEGSAVIDEGGNQKAAPLFANAAAGDYREAAGSPTVDGGIADQLGPLDLGGDPRVQGGAPDIGAFEQPPAAPASGGVRTISIKPKRFRAAKKGGPVAAGVRKSKPPVGALVIYTMSAPATVEFSVARRVAGHTAGKVCKHGPGAGPGKCFFYVPLKGVFTQDGATGSNSFVFSGRIGGKTLKPGAYKLTAFAGHLISAAFEIGGRRHHHRG
jgi:hypothetical protein